MDIDWKDLGLKVLLGAAVLIGTPLINGLLPTIGFLGTAILGITVGQALSAGASAFAAQMAIDKIF